MYCWVNGGDESCATSALSVTPEETSHAGRRHVLAMRRPKHVVLGWLHVQLAWRTDPRINHAKQRATNAFRQTFNNPCLELRHLMSSQTARYQTAPSKRLGSVPELLSNQTRNPQNKNIKQQINRHLNKRTKPETKTNKQIDRHLNKVTIGISAHTKELIGYCVTLNARDHRFRKIFVTVPSHK